MAIHRANIAASDVDYINAHGTSTPVGDEIELAAVQRLVGNAAGRISMSSTKSSIGHLLGAAGAVEAIFSILAIRDQVAPPTINLDNPSVETPVDLVPHNARRREIEIVPDPNRPSPRARHPIVVAGSAIFTLTLVVAFAAGVAFTAGKQRFEAAGPLERDKVVNIPRGLGVRDIAELLNREGVIEHTW